MKQPEGVPSLLTKFSGLTECTLLSLRSLHPLSPLIGEFLYFIDASKWRLS